MTKFFRSALTVASVSILICGTAAFAAENVALEQVKAEHDGFSQAHAQMKKEHAAMTALLKRIQRHIAMHEKEMRDHGVEIAHHGKIRNVAGVTPGVEANHAKLKSAHDAEVAEHARVLELLKQLDAAMEKR